MRTTADLAVRARRRTARAPARRPRRASQCASAGASACLSRVRGMGEAIQAFMGPQHTLTLNGHSGRVQPPTTPSRHRNGESAIGVRTLALVPPLSRWPLLVRKDEASCKFG